MIQMILRIRIFYPCSSGVDNFPQAADLKYDPGACHSLRRWPGESRSQHLWPAEAWRPAETEIISWCKIYVIRCFIDVCVACVYSNYNCICIYFNERICLSVNLYAYCLFVYIYFLKKNSVYICMYIYISLCMYICICIYVYIYISISR